MESVSWVDIGIALIFVVSTAFAVFRGFVKEAISIATWVAAIWLAIVFSNDVAILLPEGLDNAEFNMGETRMNIENLGVGIAFIMIVVGTLVFGALINYVLSQITKMQVLRGADRFLGILFGLARATAIVVILVMLASMTTLPNSESWARSKTVAPFEKMALVVVAYLPENYVHLFQIRGQQSVPMEYTL